MASVNHRSTGCLLQCGGQVEKLSTMWSVYSRRLATPVGICGRCGHLQISRAGIDKGYGQLNDTFFKKYTPLGSKALDPKHEKKYKTTIKRLAPYIIPGNKGNLLDVGAGEGWSKFVADHFEHNYFVVEASRELGDSLAATGAQLVSRSVNEIPGKFSGGFDVIILRHTLEHFTDPVASINSVAEKLSPKGILYVAVPNYLTAVPKSGFRTDFLRPSHISYFTPNKLAWLFYLAGLRICHMQETGELWAVASHTRRNLFTMINESEGNKNRFTALHHQWRKRDLINLVKIIAKRTRSRFRNRNK